MRKWPLRCVGLCVMALFLTVLQPTLSHGMEGHFVRVAQAEQAILKVKPNIDGAEVFLDGKAIGLTPLVYALDPGAYHLTIKHPYYDPFELDISAVSGQAIAVDSSLKAVAGDLLVNANIEGASVYLDGKLLGQTPELLAPAVHVGGHKIRVEKAGYLSYTGIVKIDPLLQVKLNVELTANAATLWVYSEEPGIQIHLDGEPLGLTPIESITISGGRHTLTATAPDRATGYKAFQVRIGDAREIRFSLPEKGGAIKVKSNVKEATVYFEGVAMGETPFVLSDIAPGEYQVRVSAEGYTDRVDRVRVKAGRSARVKLSLEDDLDFEAAKSRRQASRDREKRPILWAVVGAVALGGAGAGAWFYLGGGGESLSGDVTVELP